MVKKGGILTPNHSFFQSPAPNLPAWLLLPGLDLHGPLLVFCYTEKCGGLFCFGMCVCGHVFWFGFFLCTWPSMIWLLCCRWWAKPQLPSPLLPVSKGLVMSKCTACQRNPSSANRKNPFFLPTSSMSPLALYNHRSFDALLNVVHTPHQQPADIIWSKYLHRCPLGLFCCRVFRVGFLYICSKN